ncbi:WD40 repeat-like protein [Anaeromyces robustus]|uniref:WD40 repeat-like protein n=1 Tax=Anaeromyces robustus TaxID=1754192 RepID=A0A1Y1XMQ9_9FUNG|nr:WD40 repeat-like protein [Anaeromyces robustus]|eukprot:ORX87029.1 WD40 repeat-like protein [Anaeromyces robustus]
MNNNKINKDNLIEDTLTLLLKQSDNTKIDVIYKLVNSLSTISLQELSKKLDPLFHFDFLSKLPNELSIKILSYTDCKTISIVSNVSRKWHQLSLDNTLWKQLYTTKWKSLAFVKNKISQFYPYLSDIKKELELENDSFVFQFWEVLNLLENLRLKDYQNSFNKSFNNKKKTENENEIQKKYKEFENIPGLWRAIYYLHLKLDSNWNNKKYSIYNMVSHTDSIYCLQYNNERIISGSRDQTIKVWDLKTNECIKTLNGHTGSILSLQFDANYLVTGSSDSTIILWDIKSFEIVRRITGHQDSVLSVKFNKDYIVSSSKDHTIRIWDIKTGEFVRKLEGHKTVANAIQLKGDIIVSASGDRLIRAWSLSTGKLLKTFEGHTRGIACIFFDGNIIISGSSDCTLKVWDFHSNKLLFTLYGHTELVRTIQFDGKKIVSGSYDRTIKIWDFKSKQLLFSLDGHLSKIFCLQFSDSKIISCSSDKHIIKWDFSRDILNIFP